MTTFATVQWRNYEGRGVEYANVLYDGVRSNLSEGTLGKFVVFTDDVSDGQDYAEGIELRKLPEGLTGWFNKLALFAEGAFELGERIVYFDLDTIITGPIDELAAYDGPFAILRDVFRPSGLQSSVILWKSGELYKIWSEYMTAGWPEVSGGDQAWIEKFVTSPRILQKKFPDLFVSYKRDARFGIPKGSSVCFFHGRPRPHEVTDGWVPKLWKVGAAIPSQLELIPNIDSKIIESNIQRSESIPNATWFKSVPPHKKVAIICAGGPSLNSAILAIAARKVAGAHIFACNNVPRKLKACGIETDMHVIVDARPENSEFVSGIGDDAICLYASPCDQTVHDMAGDRLVLWHPAFDGVLDIVGKDKERTYIGGGTTCGMKAMVLAWSLGYREIHLYGFDSCYSGEDHHAYPQSLNDGEQILPVEFENRHYRCAPWMIQQAEDFEVFAPLLMDRGVELHVHGSGLIPDIAAQFAKGLFPQESADFRAIAILDRLEGVTSPKIAEVGVFAGDLSRRLLARRPDLNLLMIDSWSPPSEEYRKSGDFHAGLSAKEQTEYFGVAVNVTDFAKDRRTVMHMDSKEAARAIADESLDLVFIDADHSYEGCKSDMAAYWPKVREGGYLSGHDYANDAWAFGPMVKKAVDEFVADKGLDLELGPNYTWHLVKLGEQRL